ncbi:MAG: acetamidase/formamidase family protein [Candidatus Bipolaricaulota bacterium]|nr:MAG: acetamidase/formamidase family protein [Candidatus Bipolaricaulota bacterium]
MRNVPEAHTIYAFEPEMQPALTIEPPQTVVFETLDALGGQVRETGDTVDALDFSRVNPATGPVAVDGARPGDALAVEIHAVELPHQGAIIAGPGMGVLGDLIERPVARILPIEDGDVRFGDLRIPVSPMVGVIGVAPEEGSHPTGTAHRHGGNMDAREIGPRATVYLPVFRPGALLALGDVHAVMGDGEVCVSACEVSAVVTTHVRVLESRAPRWPVVETDDAIILLVSLPTIEEALREATHEAVRALERVLSLPFEDAYLLASLTVDIGVSQLVDPNKTAKAVLPKRLVGPFEAWPAS